MEGQELSAGARGGGGDQASARGGTGSAHLRGMAPERARALALADGEDA